MDSSGQQRLRDELFERAGRDEITGEQADAEAIRLGLGRLSHTPDPAEFDPLRERFWTLPMAVAWIAYGDPQRVRQQWGDYRSQCMVWTWSRYRVGPDGPVRQGWFLEQRTPPSVANLALASLLPDDSEASLRMSVREAEGALWDALCTDCFRASAVNTEGRRVEIPPLEWIDLKLILGRGDREELHFGFDRKAYREVLLPAASVRGLWAVPAASVRLTLPSQLRPEGDGYMPLSSAAQWIATKGGKVDFDPEDVEMWRPGYAELLAALASETVGVIGVTPQGRREEVAGLHFADCLIEYPFEAPDLNLVLANELHLRCYLYDDEEAWRDGFSDKLVDRNGDHWSRLMVLKSEVRDRWPFETSLPKSGAPGRPSSMYLIIAKFDERKEAGELEQTLREEATLLAEWLPLAHRDMPTLTVKAIENRIRHAYKRARSAPK